MSELFRSEPMTYVQIKVTSDAGPATVAALAEDESFHIIDLANRETPTKIYLEYKKRVAACANWERKLKFFETTAASRGVVLAPFDADAAFVNISEENDDVLGALESVLVPLEQELRLSLSFAIENQREMNQNIEKRHVFEVCGDLSGEVEAFAHERAEAASAEDAGFLPTARENKQTSLLDSAGDIEMQVSQSSGGDRRSFHSYIAGVLPTVQQPLFNRMLYRVSRGNAYARFETIHEPMIDVNSSPDAPEYIQKSVFYCVLVGSTLAAKITRLCSVFGATVHEVPRGSQDAIRQALINIAQEQREKEAVLQRTNESIVRLLTEFTMKRANRPGLRDWQQGVRREKLTCLTLMKCHVQRNFIAMEGWVPDSRLDQVRHSLADAAARVGAPSAVVEENPMQPLRTPKSPPTWFDGNPFLNVFQGIVNTYGVPRYREANPGLFTIVTFPFLFGVMYGDIGHGTCLFLFAAYCVYKEKMFLQQQKDGTINELFGMAFEGRWMLLLMGFFGVYCGLVYNDCFSIPLSLFPSVWEYPDEELQHEMIANKTQIIANKTNPYVFDVYKFGVDPMWYHTTNELTFMNSLKMKMSVCLGVGQMMFGLFLSLSNHIHFRNWLGLVFEFIPQLLFLTCTFGYMIAIIIYKWTVDWSQHRNGPPNLIQTMIGMFLKPGSVDDDKELYDGQAGIQLMLLAVAFLSVPVMLFPKPIIEHMLSKNVCSSDEATRLLSHQRHDDLGDINDGGSGGSTSPYTRTDESMSQAAKSSSSSSSSAAASKSHSGGDDEHEDESLSDRLIHSGIHTIEFVLGTVSNTASYLRLWALSLAHAQLASVFWEKMIMQYGINSSALFTFVGMAVWVAATFGVLLCMDVLECFLHALRLHWVEFQNKFFHADGYIFKPVTFKESNDDA